MRRTAVKLEVQKIVRGRKEVVRGGERKREIERCSESQSHRDRERWRQRQIEVEVEVELVHDGGCLVLTETSKTPTPTCLPSPRCQSKRQAGSGTSSCVLQCGGYG